MKSIRVTLAILLAALTVFSFFSCSPNIEEEMEEETLLTPEPEPEPPHWADGIIEIEVGRFQTGAEMLAIFENLNSGVRASTGTRMILARPDFPMSQQKKTIEVAVVTLQDVGFTEPVTTTEIRKRFKQLGYRPLTLEEAVEIRLQFLDQPEKPSEYRNRDLDMYHHRRSLTDRNQKAWMLFIRSSRRREKNLTPKVYLS